MYATSVTVLAGGRADNARPCVPIWRFRASAIRRGSAERPTRKFSAAIRRIRSRHDESIRGLPGRLAPRRQHRRIPSRHQRSTVAGRTSTSASLHRGHNHRNNNQSSRSVGRKRRCERARTPSWWRRASVSSRRSVRVACAAGTVPPVLMEPRIGCRVPGGDASVNDFPERNIGEPQVADTAGRVSPYGARGGQRASRTRRRTFNRRVNHQYISACR
jgi:hypothetical protein